MRTQLTTKRMELRPLPAAPASVLPGGREEASRILGATLSSGWPQPDLLDALPIQASASPVDEPFGIWVMIERESRSVIGDVGFIGPPGDSGQI